MIVTLQHPTLIIPYNCWEDISLRNNSIMGDMTTELKWHRLPKALTQFKEADL